MDLHTIREKAVVTLMLQGFELLRRKSSLPISQKQRISQATLLLGGGLREKGEASDITISSHRSQVLPRPSAN